MNINNYNINNNFEDIKKIEETIKNKIIESSKLNKKNKVIKKNKKIQKENYEIKKKLNKLKEDINNSRNTINNLQNKNLELYKEINIKKEEINIIHNDLVQNQNKIKLYNDQIIEEEGKTSNSEILLKNFEDQIKENQNEINRINLQNEKEKKIKEEDLNNIRNNFEQQKEKYRKELLIIKENIEKNIKQEYENKFNSEIKNYATDIYKKIKNIEKDLIQKYKKDIEKKEKILNDKFIQISNLSKSKILLEKEEDKNKLYNKCNTIHFNCFCQKCFKNPIVGYRYKCSICDNYNLCADCEEKNAETGEHSHNFVKIRKLQNNNNTIINNNNIINNNIINNDNNNKSDENNNKNDDNINNDEKELNQINNNEEYSYECLNNKLTTYILKGTKKAVVPIVLRNNGKKPWAKYKTILKIDKNKSNIKGADNMLKPQSPGQQSNYDIRFDNLENYQKGDYKAYYKFIVNGNNYGKELIISVIIKKKKNKNE